MWCRMFKSLQLYYTALIDMDCFVYIAAAAALLFALKPSVQAVFFLWF